MEQQTADNSIQSIRQAIADKKAFVGTKQTLKALRNNAAGKVYCTTNTPKEIRETVEYYSKLNNITCVTLDQSNEELGMACRKPFLISVVAVAR